MAIALKKEKDENNKEYMSVKINNGHIDALENIVEKYTTIKNEAQALDFILKAVGNNKEKAENIIVDGIPYTPANYTDN